MRNFITAGLIAASVSVAAPVQAAEVTFDFGITDFIDLNGNDVDGMVSGFFTVDDMLGSLVGTIEQAEVTAFSATISGFTGTLAAFNGVLSGIAELFIDSNTGFDVELAGSGLSLDSIIFGDPFAGSSLLMIPGDDLGLVENYAGAGDIVADGLLTITLRDDPNGGGGGTNPVPLPAALPLLLAGLGALGIARRRQRG